MGGVGGEGPLAGQQVAQPGRRPVEGSGGLVDLRDARRLSPHREVAVAQPAGGPGQGHHGATQTAGLSAGQEPGGGEGGHGEAGHGQPGPLNLGVEPQHA